MSRHHLGLSVTAQRSLVAPLCQQRLLLPPMLDSMCGVNLPPPPPSLFCFQHIEAHCALSGSPLCMRKYRQSLGLKTWRLTTGGLYGMDWTNKRRIRS